MFAVNFAGTFRVTPAVLKHHNTYCSYADTIMPQFLFAVGFALRLVMLRNSALLGPTAACMKALRRIVMLTAVGLLYYFADWLVPSRGRPFEWRTWGPPNFWREAFQTLVHIAVTSLWILPVIAGSARARLALAAGSAALHLAMSASFWYPMLHEKRVIDGGPPGFLTWTLPAIAGSFAFDWWKALGPRGALRPLVLWGVALMLAGYLISCAGSGGHLAAPPFIPPWRPVDMWTMSQRAGSVSYLTFAAGFSLAVHAGFVLLCDLHHRRSAFLGTLGANALAAYILHGALDVAFSPFKHSDAPAATAVALTLLYMAAVTLLVHQFNRRGWYWRL